MRKAFTNYSRNLLLAGGITNDEIENFLSVIVDKTLPDYTSALKGIELKIYKEKNTTIYEQSFMVNGVVDENFSLRVEFKPIEKINSNNLTKYGIFVIVGISLIYLVITSILIKDLKYPTEHPFFFTLETILFSFGCFSILKNSLVRFFSLPTFS